MTDFNGLAVRLTAKAGVYRGNQVGDLLTEAATAVRVQAAHIADLEAEVERLLRQCSNLDAEIVRLDESIDHAYKHGNDHLNCGECP